MKTSGDFYHKWLIVYHQEPVSDETLFYGGFWKAYNGGLQLCARTRARIKQKIDKKVKTSLQISEPLVVPGMIGA